MIWIMGGRTEINGHDLVCQVVNQAVDASSQGNAFAFIQAAYENTELDMIADITQGFEYLTATFVIGDIIGDQEATTSHRAAPLSGW